MCSVMLPPSVWMVLGFVVGNLVCTGIVTAAMRHAARHRRW